MQRQVTMSSSDHEFGLPMVQDDDNIDSMQQITLGNGMFKTTGGRDYNNNGHFSVSTAAFGGAVFPNSHNDSPDVGHFANTRSMMDSELEPNQVSDQLNSLQSSPDPLGFIKPAAKKHSMKGTFGAEYVQSLNSASVVSAAFKESFHKSDEDLQIGQDQEGDLEQDFIFIDELITNYQNEMTERTQPLAQIIQESFSDPQSLHTMKEDNKSKVVGDVTEIEQGFKKMLELSSKYL